MATPIFSILDAADYESQIARCAELLNQGGVVIIPMETVYGIAARLDCPAGLKRLKELCPESAQNKPLTIHLANGQDAYRYLGPVNDLGRRMIRKLWPGPVALVFEVPADRRAQVAAEMGIAESDIYEGSEITLRCPDHAVASDVIWKVGGPVVATVAGSGGSPVTREGTLDKELEGKVDLVIEAGPPRYSKPSTIVRVEGERYRIVRPGVYDERIIDRLLRTTILFVCSGNTCRSPMAEAIARRVLAERLKISENELEKKGIIVLSAGSYAFPGARATPQAVEAVKRMGADLSKHRSRPLTVELIHQADVVFTMSQSHSQVVTSLVPSAAEKVKTLDPNGEIDDPIGGSEALYQELAGQLRKLIEQRLDETVLP